MRHLRAPILFISIFVSLGAKSETPRGQKTLEQCQSELGQILEVYKTSSTLSESNGENSFDVLSPMTEKTIRNDLAKANKNVIADVYKANYQNCQQLYPESFASWNESLLADVIQIASPTREQNLLPAEAPSMITLNSRTTAGAKTHNYDVKALVRGDQSDDSPPSPSADKGTD